jgi:site-specific DNA-methyltransferase (adenine-specific)
MLHGQHPGPGVILPGKGGRTDMDTPNRLYFGDCLEVMRADVASESVDLIYLDPPFNSKRLYNAFIGGAQWVAFDDTWRWYEAIGDFHEVAQQPAYSGLMEGLRSILGEGPELAYLSYMANRLLECHRVLKPTGSIYLHCDPTMSHYLKLVMDGIWGKKNFVNEVVWCYEFGGRVSKRAYGRRHDTIFFYAQSLDYRFNYEAVLNPWDAEGQAKFRHKFDIKTNMVRIG